MGVRQGRLISVSLSLSLHRRCKIMQVAGLKVRQAPDFFRDPFHPLLRQSANPASDKTSTSSPLCFCLGLQMRFLCSLLLFSSSGLLPECYRFATLLLGSPAPRGCPRTAGHGRRVWQWPAALSAICPPTYSGYMVIKTHIPKIGSKFGPDKFRTNFGYMCFFNHITTVRG